MSNKLTIEYYNTCFLENAITDAMDFCLRIIPSVATASEGNEKILYQFKNYKITKEEISSQSNDIVMVVRPSMQFDLDHISGIEGGNIIYSMWEGYLKKSGTKKFMDYLSNRQFTFYNIHTSGHADTKTLQQMADAINPKNIVPIHTFCGTEYQKLFTQPVVLLKDGESVQIK